MRNATDRIETAELSDADLDNVSGGVGVNLPGGLGGADVTAVPGGVSASVGANVPGVGGVAGGVGAGLDGVNGSVSGGLA